MAVPIEAPAVVERPAGVVHTSVRGLGIALVGALIGFYIVTGMPQLRLNAFGPTVTLHMVTAAVVLVYLVYLALYRRLPGGSPIDWPLVLVVGAYGLATAASIYWRVSFENLLLVLMAVVVFYALSDIRILSARDLQRGIMLAGAAASFYALWVVGQDYSDWLALARSVDGFSPGDLVPPTVPRVHDVSDHPNILAMTLVLIVPFYALTIYHPEAWWERVAGAVGLGAALLAIFLTLSRGAWVGSVIGLAATAGGIAALAVAARGVSFSPDVPLRWLRRNRAATILLAVALVAVVAVVALLAASLFDSRPQWLFRSSLSPRQDVLSAGFDMFKDYPLLGAGPNTYALLYPEYSGEFAIHGVHAHNAYLQAAIDLGLPGLAALLAVGGVLGWMVWRTVRGGTSSQQLLAVASAGALVGFLIHGLVDAPNIWKAPLIALAAVGAVAVRNYREVGESGPAEADEMLPQAELPSLIAVRIRQCLSVVPRIFVLVFVAALLVGWGRVDTAHFYYDRGVTRADEVRLPEAISAASRAVDLDPQFAIYQLQLGLTEVRAYLEGGSRTLLDQGIRHLRRGVELEPRGALGYANLARAMELAGDREEARHAALAARMRAGVDEESVVLAVGIVLEDLGEVKDAVETYAKAITLSPALADSAFWTSSPFRQEHYGEILAGSALAFRPCMFGSLVARSPGLAETALEAGANLSDLANRCAKRIARSPNDVARRIELGETLLAAGELDVAREHIEFAVDREPDNGPARTALGRWYAEAGDVEAARDQWLLAAQLEDPEGVLLLGESYPPGAVPNAVIRTLGELLPRAGGGARNDIVSILYYRMGFGRQSPVVMLIPGEWQEAVPRQHAAMKEALLRWRGDARMADP